MPKAHAVASKSSCVSCGSPLRPAALFCTGCGTRVKQEATSSSACTSCGHSLREGAEFCTECGTAVVAATSVVDLSTGDDTTTETGDGSADTDTALPPPPSPAERVSPAASRAILGAVGGGMGSYMGAAKTASSGATVPPVGAASTGNDDKNRRNKILIGVGIGVVVLLLGVAAMVMATKDDSSSLRAGQGKTPTDQARRNHAGKGDDASTTTDGGTSTTDADKSDKSDKSSTGSDTTVGGKKSSSGSKKGTKSSGGSSTTHGGSHGTPGTTSGGTTGSSRPPLAPPPVVTTPGPARLQIGTSSLSVTGNARTRSFYVQNVGGMTMHWSAGVSGVPSISVSPSSGNIAPGKYTKVTVEWHPWASMSDPFRAASDEGHWNGTVNVNAGNAGNRSLPLAADNMAKDSAIDAYLLTCPPTGGDTDLCRPGATLRIVLKRSVQGPFTGSQPAQVRIAVNTEGNLSSWQPIRLESQKTYPNAAFVFESPNSILRVKRDNKGPSRIWIQVQDDAGNIGPLKEMSIWK